MFDGQSIQQLRSDLLAELRSSPEGWDFRSSAKCAIAIVGRLTGRCVEASDVATLLGMPGHESVFVDHRGYGVSHLDRVTPRMVADRIEGVWSKMI